MTDSILDMGAWLILGFLWVFGGAGLLNCRNSKYTDVLIGWVFLHVAMGIALVIAFALHWAVIRVFT